MSRRLPMVAIAAGVLAATGSTPARADTAPCASVVLIGARGSGERSDTFDGVGEVVDQMAGEFDGWLAARDMTLQVVADPYPAEPTSDLYRFWHGRFRRYFRSIDAGIDDAIALARQVVAACPGVSLVMAGYSQGAMVVHQAERRLAAEEDGATLARIAGTVLVGDGDRVARTRAAARFGAPAAVRGEGIRTWAWHRRGDVELPQTTVDVCSAGDLVCDFGLRRLAGPGALRRAIRIHVSYASGSLPVRAADWLAQRLVGSGTQRRRAATAVASAPS